MKIHEYQAKSLFREHNIAVPMGAVATTAAAARKVAAGLDSSRYVVKGQIHAGGRGRGGGVKVAASLDDVERLAGDILGMTLITKQTGPEGRLVQSVLVEAATDIAHELYLSVLVDRAATRLLLMGSRSGGMDIEEVAATRPEAIVRTAIDPLIGLRPYQARDFATRMGLNQTSDQLRAATSLLTNLVDMFHAVDASMIEINPLVITGSGEIIALDGKIDLDDNALYRHPQLKEFRDLNEEDPHEIEASKFSLNYIKLDGDIGCMVNGAGLAMATMDIIQLSGHAPANFLDVGGGANVERIANALRILTSDTDVKAVLVNIFGGIVRCDRVAEGIIAALQTVQVDMPMVVRLEGTNAIEARELLAKSGHQFVVASTLADAADKIVKSLATNA